MPYSVPNLRPQWVEDGVNAERSRFIAFARRRFAEEMYAHGAATGKQGGEMALEALLSRSPDGLEVR